MLKYISTNPFVLIDSASEKVIDTFKTLGVVYDVVVHDDMETTILLKHGNYDNVRYYYEGLKSVLGEMGSNIQLVKVEECTVDDVNFILEHSAITREAFEKKILSKVA